MADLPEVAQRSGRVRLLVSGPQDCLEEEAGRRRECFVSQGPTWLPLPTLQPFFLQRGCGWGGAQGPPTFRPTLCPSPCLQSRCLARCPSQGRSACRSCRTYCVLLARFQLWTLVNMLPLPCVSFLVKDLEVMVIAPRLGRRRRFSWVGASAAVGTDLRSGSVDHGPSVQADWHH